MNESIISITARQHGTGGASETPAGPGVRRKADEDGSWGRTRDSALETHVSAGGEGGRRKVGACRAASNGRSVANKDAAESGASPPGHFDHCDIAGIHGNQPAQLHPPKFCWERAI